MLIRSSIIFLTLFIVAAGCTTTTKTFSSDPKVIEEITRTSAEREVKITLKNGIQKSGLRLAMRMDSTEWYASDNRQPLNGAFRRVVPTASIQSLSFDAPNGYIWKVSLIGAATGFVLLGILYFAFSNDPFFGPPRPIKIGEFLPAVGLGALGGAVEGFLFGVPMDALHTFDYARDTVVMRPQEH
jgi:hypothetical protein